MLHDAARKHWAGAVIGVAHEAADDPQDFGACRLASVSFIKFPRKLLDLSAKLLLYTAGQHLGRHDDAQRFEYSRKSRDHPTALLPMGLSAQTSGRGLYLLGSLWACHNVISVRIWTWNMALDPRMTLRPMALADVPLLDLWE